MNINNLYKYVKDHLIYWGFFPADYEEKEITVTYPNYMRLFNDKQIKELAKIFNKHPKFK